MLVIINFIQTKGGDASVPSVKVLLKNYRRIVTFASWSGHYEIGDTNDIWDHFTALTTGKALTTFNGISVVMIDYCPILYYLSLKLYVNVFRQGQNT